MARPQRRQPVARTALTALGLLTLLLAGLGGCTALKATPPVQRLSRYETLLALPLAQRVLPADAAVLERAHRTNLTYGEDVRPQAADHRDPLASVVGDVLAHLPPAVERLAAAHLAAVYLVRGDVGTATTEAVQDAQGRWSHAYIVLNLTALQRDANAWATWKEHSTFRDSPGYALRMTIEPPASDGRAGAARFILLHELGHVLGAGLGVHGSWEDPRPVPPATRDSAFVALSWVYEAAADGRPARMRSRYAERFPRLSRVAFYRFDKAPLTLAEAPAIYDDLAHTNFPSLYGTEGLFDDFAESFVIYVHTVLLGRPYRVEVLHDGVPVQTYRSCIVTGGCPRKVAMLQALLNGATSRPPTVDARRSSAPPASPPSSPVKPLMALDNTGGTH